MPHNRLRELIISTDKNFHLTETIPFMDTDTEDEKVKQAIAMGQIVVDQFDMLPTQSKLSLLIALAEDKTKVDYAMAIEAGTIAIEKKDMEVLSTLKTTILKVGLLLTGAIVAHAFVPELLDVDARKAITDTFKLIVGL